LAGQSHLILKFWSDCTLETGIQLQKSDSIAAIAAFFENLRINLSFIGDGKTVESALDYLKEFLRDDFHNFKEVILSFYTLIDDLDLTLNFKSWKEVPLEEHDVIKSNIMKEFIEEDFASIIAGVSEFFEKDCRLVFVLSETVHLDIKLRIPGLTNYATLCMDP